MSGEELRLFELYLSELLKWNAKVNLTAITEPDEIIIKHFLDSLALLRILPYFSPSPGLWPPSPTGWEGKALSLSLRWERGGGEGEQKCRRNGEYSFSQAIRLRFAACDIGSGAGFPGLALKIVLPETDITLVEPARKKAAFLRHVIRTLGLSGAKVLEAAVGAAPGRTIRAAPPPSSFDVVFSRAFRGLPELLAAAGPLLTDGGYVAQSLSISQSTGAGPADRPRTIASSFSGWAVEREEVITLPFSDINRRLILLKKHAGENLPSLTAAWLDCSTWNNPPPDNP